jgi:hypothetical protein
MVLPIMGSEIFCSRLYQKVGKRGKGQKVKGDNAEQIFFPFSPCPPGLTGEGFVLPDSYL